MDFKDAVEFLAGVFIIVGAGIWLGYGLRGRSGKPDPHAVHRKADLYAEIIHAMDKLTAADRLAKDHFVEFYYQGLIEASDSVVKSLNKYLEVVSNPDSSDDQVTIARDNVALAMRRDVQEVSGGTKLRSADLLSIEVKDPTPVSPPAPNPVETPSEEAHS
jgi:hypothetical protein